VRITQNIEDFEGKDVAYSHNNVLSLKTMDYEVQIALQWLSGTYLLCLATT
jgi:hypothetical protein